MNTIKLTPENVTQYINHEIIFKTRNNHILKRILGVSTTDHPDLQNSLERKVYVIL